MFDRRLQKETATQIIHEAMAHKDGFHSETVKPLIQKFIFDLRGRVSHFNLFYQHNVKHFVANLPHAIIQCALKEKTFEAERVVHLLRRFKHCGGNLDVVKSLLAEKIMQIGLKQGFKNEAVEILLSGYHGLGGDIKVIDKKLQAMSP